MRVRRAVQADIPAMVDCQALAFLDDPVFTYLHPRRHEYYEDYRNTRLQGTRDRFFSAPDMVIWVCETDDQDPDYDEKKSPQITGVAISKRVGESEIAKKWRATTWWSSMYPYHL
jgi:hypothetical protein